MRQISAFVVVVKAIAHDEIIFDVKASVIDFKVNFQTTWFNEKGSNINFLRILFAQHMEHLLHRIARFDDVFHNHHGTSGHVFVQPDELLHFACGAGALL